MLLKQQGAQLSVKDGAIKSTSLHQDLFAAVFSSSWA